MKKSFLSVRSVSSPLIGRDKELQTIQDLFEQVAVDQGQILGIVAGPGMGKSRMVNALKELAGQNHLPVYQGVFTASYQPYEAFRQVISQMAGSDTDTLSRWNLTETEIDFLRLLLEPQAEIESIKNLTETEIQYGLFASVKKLIFTMAKTPMVIILEDVHWAGKNSQDMLEYLIDDTESTRLLLVVVHRPDIVLPWTRRLNYTTMKLAPFEKFQIERMVRNVLDIDHLDSRVITELLRVSQGNPLFLEEMLKHMIEQKEIEIFTDEDGSKALLLRKSAATLPTSLHSLIESRLKLLSPNAYMAFQWASVIGSVGDTDELQNFLEEKIPNEAKPAIQELFKQGYLVERSAFPTRTYRFGHDLFFDVVSKSVPEETLRAYRKEFGHFLIRFYKDTYSDIYDRLANYFLQSDDEISAIRFARLAGIHALKLYHYTDACHYFQQAFVFFRRNYVPDLPEEDFYIPFLESLLATAKTEEAEEVFNRWKKNENDFSTETRIHHLRLLTQLYEHKGNHEKIIEITNSIRLLSSQNALYNELFLELSHSRINALVFLGEVDKAVHEGLEFLKSIGNQRHPFIRLRLWGRLVYCNQIRNKTSVGLDFVDKAENLYTEDLPPAHQIELLSRIRNIYRDNNQYDMCRRIYSQILEISKRYGLRRQYCGALITRGTMFSFIGNYTSAISDLSQALLENRKLLDAENITETKLSLIESLLEIGAKEKATTLWLEKEAFPISYDKWQVPTDLSNQATFCYLKGDFKKSILLLREAAEAFKNINAHRMFTIYKWRALRLECECDTRSKQEISNEFLYLEDLSSEPGDELYWEKNITAMCLLAHGIDVAGVLDPNLDISKCTLTNRRLQAYVWKIKWLLHQGKREEADQVRKLFKEDKENVARNIPAEYRADFFTHPLYQAS